MMNSCRIVSSANAWKALALIPIRHSATTTLDAAMCPRRRCNATQNNRQAMSAFINSHSLFKTTTFSLCTRYKNDYSERCATQQVVPALFNFCTDYCRCDLSYKRNGRKYSYCSKFSVESSKSDRTFHSLLGFIFRFDIFQRLLKSQLSSFRLQLMSK